MENLLKLIDALIAEHKEVKDRTYLLENVSNDTTLLSDLAKARKNFVSGRLDEARNLQTLEETLIAIDIWLKKHFSLEENILLKTVKSQLDQKIVDSLNSLLFEHSDLRARMEHSKKRVNELISGSLAPNIWDATANDTSVYINHTVELLQTHAERENILLSEMRKNLKTKKTASGTAERKVSLSVNNKPIILEEFVEGYVYHITGGILASLKDTGAFKTMALDIDDTGDVKITVNGKDVRLSFFPVELVRNTLAGMVANFKGVDGKLKTLALRIEQ